MSTASLDVVLKRWAPAPPQLTLQGIAGSPALDSGLQDTTDPGQPWAFEGGGGCTCTLAGPCNFASVMQGFHPDVASRRMVCANAHAAAHAHGAGVGPWHGHGHTRAGYNARSHEPFPCTLLCPFLCDRGLVRAGMGAKGVHRRDSMGFTRRLGRRGGGAQAARFEHGGGEGGGGGGRSGPLAGLSPPKKGSMTGPARRPGNTRCLNGSGTSV